MHERLYLNGNTSCVRPLVPRDDVYANCNCTADIMCSLISIDARLAMEDAALISAGDVDTATGTLICLISKVASKCDDMGASMIEEAFDPFCIKARLAVLS